MAKAAKQVSYCIFCESKEVKRTAKKIYCIGCRQKPLSFNVPINVTPNEIETNYGDVMVYCYNCGEMLTIDEGQKMCIDGCGLITINISGIIATTGTEHLQQINSSLTQQPPIATLLPHQQPSPIYQYIATPVPHQQPIATPVPHQPPITTPVPHQPKLVLVSTEDSFASQNAALIRTLYSSQLDASAGIVGGFIHKKGKSAVNTNRKAIVPTYHHPFRMILLGETGSGKTSFLNLLCNSTALEELVLSEEKKLQKIQQFNDIKLENASKRVMESKTSDAKCYNVKVWGLKIGIIDTPGFGDSRGFEQDKKNVAKIIELLKKEDYVNCVCLVINGRDSRMTTTLMYVLSEITAILPKEVLNNVIVVFTNTAEVLDRNFDVKELDNYFGKRITTTFCIENPYCRLEKAKGKAGQLAPEVIIKSLQKSFDETVQTLHDMWEQIKDLQPVHTKRFVVLYEKKQEIERSVIKLLTAYDYQTQLKQKINKTNEEVDAALRTKKLNNDFKTTHIVKCKTPIDTPDKRHNTLCGYPDCYSNCHMPCYLAKTYDKEEIKRCAAMDGTDYCKVCRHHYNVHYHNEVYFKEVEKKEELVDSKMKQKFEQAKTMEEKARILKDDLLRKQQESDRQKASLSQQLKTLMNEFQSLGISKRNYLKLLESQLHTIEIRIEGAVYNDELRKTKEDIKIRIDIVKSALKITEL